jgi:pumilio family protein 6
LYLLAGRKPRYFFKQVLDLLASGDEIRARTSKKDPELRFNELLEAISPDVIQFVAEHPEIVLQNYGSQLVTETLISAKGKQPSS